MNYQKLRREFDTITYQKYEIFDNNNEIKVTYTYQLGKYTFTPSIHINKKYITNKNINDSFLEYLFFNFGMVNIINYYKLTCPKNIIIEALYIDNNQIDFFKKLIWFGLGEYFYRNNINLSYEEFTNFKVTSNKKISFSINDCFNGNLVLVGGGKDSIVSLEILRNEKDNNLCYLMERDIYPKNIPSYNSIYKALYTDNHIRILTLELDKTMIELNKQGFLNGHIPVSSLLAFSSYIMAYLNNKKYIVVSNEASSNYGNVDGLNINHQYSKSIEFENDFRSYTSKYFIKDIEYFSMLRPLLEIQIAKIFSQYPQYFNIFRSCNLASKNSNTNWCCNCAKCLFIFIILSPYIDIKTLINIFGENLLEKESMLVTFKELIGKSTNKPFECVGTYEEVMYACNKTIDKYQNKNMPLPLLLKYYNDNYKKEILNLEKTFNDNHNVPLKYIKLIKKELDIYE